MKNNLEDQFKNAFDRFEPEVDPSLWTKISSQLPAAPAPVQPASVPFGPLASLSSAGSWIAAAAVALVAGTAIYFSLNRSADVKPQPTPVKSPSTEVVTPENETAEHSLPQEEKIQLPLNKDGSQARPSTETTVKEAKPSAPTATVINTPAQPVQDNTEPVIITPSAVATPQSKPQNPAVSNTSSQTENAVTGNESAVKVPLRIMVNTNGGFAPLTVTVLSNQADKKADFDFGDGVSVRGESATHVYKEAGVYRIDCNLGDQQSGQEIEVLEALPSAFSPNGDGANDLYTISSADIRETELRIFTRNGRLAFSGKGDSVSWNGTYPDGRPAETGTYFYDIFVTSARGNIYKQKGTLTLFR